MWGRCESHDGQGYRALALYCQPIRSPLLSSQEMPSVAPPLLAHTSHPASPFPPPPGSASSPEARRRVSPLPPPAPKARAPTPYTTEPAAPMPFAAATAHSLTLVTLPSPSSPCPLSSGRETPVPFAAARAQGKGPDYLYHGARRAPGQPWSAVLEAKAKAQGERAQQEDYGRGPVRSEHNENVKRDRDASEVRGAGEEGGGRERGHFLVAGGEGAAGGIMVRGL